MTLTQIESFVKAHERLLIVVLGAVLLWGCVGKVESIIAAHDQKTLTQAELVLQAQIDKNAALIQQAQQQAQQYAQLAQQVQQQNTQLEQTNAALIAQLRAQQKTDSTLTDPELIARWKQLVPQVDAVVANNQIQVTDAGAHATVSQLEEVPALQSELTNEQTRTQNEEKLVAQCNAQVATLGQEVTGLNAQIVDQKKKSSAQVAVVKAEARKSKLKWFVGGVLTVVTFLAVHSL